MGEIIDILVPVFGLVAIGYAATFTPVFDESAARGLAAFVFNFALPVALFRAMLNSGPGGDTPFGFMAAYYGGTALMFLPALLFGPGGLDRRTILGFGCAYSNTVLLGIPLVVTALGPGAAVPILLLISLHSAIFFTLVTTLIEVSRGAEEGLRKVPWRLAKGLVSNILLLSLVLGILGHLAGLQLSGPIDRVSSLLAQAAFPGALFAMGAALRRYKIAGALATSAMVVVAKLVLHPIIVAVLALWVFDMPPLWAHTAILAASLPVGVNVYLFAMRYQLAEAEAATAILLSNIVSVATIAIVLAVLGISGPAPG